MPELLTRIDVWIVIVYLAAMLVVAFCVSSGSRDVEGYTVGNRSMRGWVLGISVLGTFLSSITFLGLPAKTFQGDWNAFVFGLALPPAALLATLYFVPLYRTGTRLSAYQLLEERFGAWARIYADASYLLLQLIRIGTVLLLVAFAVEPMLSAATADELRARYAAETQAKARYAAETQAKARYAAETQAKARAEAEALANPQAEVQPTDADGRNIDRMVTILLTLGVLVIVYDTLGGIRAVIWTDVLQVGVLLFGALWCLGAIVVQYDGGMAGFFQSIPSKKLSLGPVSHFDPETSRWDWTIASVWVVLIYGLSENLRNYGVDQNYVQRMFAAQSNREAAKSIWIGALAYVPISVIFCLIGTGLWMIAHQGQGNFLPPELQADQVFPYFIRYALSPPVAGLVIAAVLAAAMSTVDSSLNSCSTVLLVDVIRPLVRKLREHGHLRRDLPEIFLIRGCTVVFGIIGTGMAVVLLEIKGQSGSKALMDLWWAYAGMAGSGMFGLFLLAWLMPSIPSSSAALGVLVNAGIVLWGLLASDLPANSPWALLECQLHPNLVGVAGTAAMLLIGLACRLGVRMRWLPLNGRALRVQQAVGPNGSIEQPDQDSNLER